MAVTQFFTIELSEAASFDNMGDVPSKMTLSRADAERLFHDLGMALYPNVAQGPQNGSEYGLEPGDQSTWYTDEEEQAAGATVTLTPAQIEKRLAAEQALAGRTEPPNPTAGRNPGSGIGNIAI